MANVIQDSGVTSVIQDSGVTSESSRIERALGSIRAMSASYFPTVGDQM